MTKQLLKKQLVKKSLMKKTVNDKTVNDKTVNDKTVKKKLFFGNNVVKQYKQLIKCFVGVCFWVYLIENIHSEEN